MGRKADEYIETMRRLPGYLPSGLHSGEVADEMELLLSELEEYRTALSKECRCAGLGPMTVCGACQTLSYYDD